MFERLKVINFSEMDTSLASRMNDTAIRRKNSHQQKEFPELGANISKIMSHFQETKLDQN